MDSAAEPAPFSQMSSDELPHGELTCTYPPWRDGDVGKIRSSPPPSTSPADPPEQSFWSATSDAEFEFPSVLAATAGVVTRACWEPKIAPKNDWWVSEI